MHLSNGLMLRVRDRRNRSQAKYFMGWAKPRETDIEDRQKKRVKERWRPTDRGKRQRKIDRERERQKYRGREAVVPVSDPLSGRPLRVA